jgi:hypothetical protein
VHARMIELQNFNHARQLLLNLFESSRCGDLIDARRRKFDQGTTRKGVKDRVKT